MASLEVLPKNWRSKAAACLDPSLANLKELPGVYVDDNCPLYLSVIVSKGGELFRITDPADTLLLLKTLRFSPTITELFSAQQLPKKTTIH